MSLRPFIYDTAAKFLNGIGRQRHRDELRVLMFHGLTDRVHEGLENCQHKHLHVRHFELLVDYTGLPPCKLFCVMADKCVPADCLLAMSKLPSKAI